VKQDQLTGTAAKAAAKQLTLEIMFLMKSAKTCFGRLVREMRNNNKICGNNSYPTTMEKALSMLENWKGRSQAVSSNNNEATGVSFTNVRYPKEQQKTEFP
jgi:hypothetical protein